MRPRPRPHEAPAAWPAAQLKPVESRLAGAVARRGVALGTRQVAMREMTSRPWLSGIHAGQAIGGISARRRLNPSCRQHRARLS